MLNPFPDMFAATWRHIFDEMSCQFLLLSPNLTKWFLWRKLIFPRAQICQNITLQFGKRYTNLAEVCRHARRQHLPWRFGWTQYTASQSCWRCSKVCFFGCQNMLLILFNHLPHTWFDHPILLLFPGGTGELGKQTLNSLSCKVQSSITAHPLMGTTLPSPISTAVNKQSPCQER